MEYQAELVSQIEALPISGQLPPYGQRTAPKTTQPTGIQPLSRRWHPFAREAAPTEQHLAHWLSQPGVRLLALQDAEQHLTGQALLLPSREVLFVLPPPSPGKVYQVWVTANWQRGEPLIPVVQSGSGLLTASLGNSNYICLSLEDRRRAMANQTTPTQMLGWANVW